MKLFYVSLLVLGTQLGYAQTVSVGDREIRERLEVIEEKLTGLDEKVSEIKNLITSKEVAPAPIWSCTGLCVYTSYGTGISERAYGQGSNSIEAMKDLVNQCKKIKSYAEVYMNETGTELATVRNSCQKE